MWTLPGSRAKIAETHLIPLSDLAIQVLDETANGEVWAGSGIVFTTNGKNPVSGFSKAKSALDAAILSEEPRIAAQVKNGLPRNQLNPWRLHDLRWKEEKREALRAWGSHVLALVQ